MFPGVAEGFYWVYNMEEKGNSLVGKCDCIHKLSSLEYRFRRTSGEESCLGLRC